MADPMTLEEALGVSDQASPMPARAHLALQVLRAEVERLRELKEPPFGYQVMSAAETGRILLAAHVVVGERGASVVGWPEVLQHLGDGAPLFACPVKAKFAESQVRADPVAELVSDGNGGGRISWLTENYLPLGTKLFAGPQPDPTPKPIQVLRVTRERRAVHTFRLADGRFLDVPEDVHRVELRDAAGPTDAYYPAPCLAGRSPDPDLCKKLLAGDALTINLTANRPEGEGFTFPVRGSDETNLPRAENPEPPGLPVFDVGYHTRTLTLVLQKTVHGDDVFQPLADNALEEFIAECRKDSWDPDPARRPIAGMGRAKGCFDASNGVRIDWIASELDPPEVPRG